MHAPITVDLPQPLPGFTQFISSWIYESGGKVLVVDPGPASTIPLLKSELIQRGYNRIDYLLLTHIHVDHAGGAGALVASFPVDKVVCHAKAIPHLVDPTELMVGSVQTLGNLMDLYGPFAPISEDLLQPAASFSASNLNVTVIPSPGHAPHHISYLVDGFLFIGEAIGVTAPVAKNHTLANPYLRPATPPRFIYTPYVESIARLAEIPASTICFGHFGTLPWSSEIFATAKEQIDTWLASLRQIDRNIPLDDVIYELIQRDRYFAGFTELSEAHQHRERIFIENSVRGIRGFLHT